MNNLHTIVLETPSRHGTILRLRLRQAPDRVAHSLELDGGGPCQELAASVEGAAADRWPPSPPLIDLFPTVAAADEPVDQRVPGPPRLLATGAAGTSFWSLAITRTPEAIVFEHACRLREPAGGFLGSTYMLPGPAIVIDHQSASLPTPLGNVQVEIHQLDQHESEMRFVGRRLVFSARSSLQTVRWQYQFSFPT